MRGRTPKPPDLRRRRNKVATSAQLSDTQKPRKGMPDLPIRLADDGAVCVWGPMTIAWWNDVWRSPMAAEFVQADVHGLYRLAVLVDRFWVYPTKDFAAEIRLQQAAYGLTPLDRRRLQWEIKRAEGDKAEQPTPARARGDPRRALRAVK